MRNKQPAIKQPGNHALSYEVVKTFKYGGTRLVKGDTWIPTGGKWDNILLERNFVKEIKKPVKTGRPRKKVTA